MIIISEVYHYLKAMWHKKQSKGIDNYFCKLESSIDTIINKCTKIEKQLEADIRILTSEVEKYKGMLSSIAEALPDIMWCKDMNGKYIYANSAIKKGLLFSNDPIGKTDIELANKAKELYGDDNHTFGEKCENSDKVVKESGLPQRFLECGKVKGKMLYLEVFKAPLIVNGKMVGVVGTGRDLTEYVEAYRNGEDCRSCKKGIKSDLFSKYEFLEIKVRV